MVSDLFKKWFLCNMHQYVVFVCPKSVIDKMAEFKPFSATIHQLQFSKMVLIIPHIFLYMRIFPWLNQNKPFHSRGWTMSSILSSYISGIFMYFSDVQWFHRCFIRRNHAFPMVFPWFSHGFPLTKFPASHQSRRSKNLGWPPWEGHGPPLPKRWLLFHGKTMGKPWENPCFMIFFEGFSEFQLAQWRNSFGWSHSTGMGTNWMRRCNICQAAPCLQHHGSNKGQRSSVCEVYVLWIEGTILQISQCNPNISRSVTCQGESFLHEMQVLALRLPKFWKQHWGLQDRSLSPSCQRQMHRPRQRR